MSLPNNPEKLNRFIHECFHEIARDKEMKDVWIDMVSMIISKWEEFRSEYLEDNGHSTGT